MSLNNRFNVIPAGAEDDDSDEDFWQPYSQSANADRQLSQQQTLSQIETKEESSTLHSGNQRSLFQGFGAIAKDPKPVCEKQRKEAALEEFRLALSANRTDAALTMINNNFDVNATSRSGWSPLMYAVEAGDVSVAKKMLEMGADAHHHIDNFSVLMTGCKCRKSDGEASELIELLVETYQVKVLEAKDRYHSTPLMYAAMEGHVDVVKYLVERCKVPVDSYDARGHTALMLGIRRGQLEVARFLLDQGADRNKMNIDGKTAKEMSMDSGNVAIINLLHDKSTHVSALDAFNEVSRYGEIDHFFYGLQLHELIDIFRDHKVEFKQLLLLSEADLLIMGVKMGDVKTISEAIHAIHKQPWNKTALHKFDPQTRNVLKCTEAVALIGNIGKHASLMCSSIGYAADQVKMHPSVIESGIDNGGALQLRRVASEALANCRALERELVILDNFVNEPISVANAIPVDKIEKGGNGKRGKRQRMNKRFPLLALGLLGLCLFGGFGFIKKRFS